MKVAVIGSRTLKAEDLGRYMPDGVTEIVSGGAKGIDESARNYARQKGLRMTEFFPDYAKYGKTAPLKRNISIIEYADEVIAFWDGSSHGTRFVIENCKRMNKKIKVYCPKTKAPATE